MVVAMPAEYDEQQQERQQERQEDLGNARI